MSAQLKKTRLLAMDAKQIDAWATEAIAALKRKLYRLIGLGVRL
jgi:hypothetical protein